MELSQTKLILQHLIEHGKITSMEAFILFGATRLSAIIYTLRHNYGYDIISLPKVIETRYGRKTQIAVYELKSLKKGKGKDLNYEH